MKRSKNKEENPFAPVTLKVKILVWIIITSPFWILGGMELLWAYYKAHPDKPNGPKFQYDYKIKEPDIVYKPPIIRSTRKPTQINQSGNGIVLKLNGVTINTGVDADEILQQLTLDYQDLFDQYGGSEELY